MREYYLSTAMNKQEASTRYIAFLGGINVGGHRVKMDHLCRLFEELRFSSVSTFIASGNVLFEAPSADTAALETTIESHLLDSLGYKVPAFLRTPAQVASVVAHRPFSEDELRNPSHTLHVSFLRQSLNAEEANAIRSFRTAMDDFHVHGRELYWLCRGKTTESLVKWQVVGKKIAKVSTARNITMLRKLMAAHPARG
jgi:uncharacterized protein (DUF1697 family)